MTYKTQHRITADNCESISNMSYFPWSSQSRAYFIHRNGKTTITMKEWLGHAWSRPESYTEGTKKMQEGIELDTLLEYLFSNYELEGVKKHLRQCEEVYIIDNDHNNPNRPRVAA